MIQILRKPGWELNPKDKTVNIILKLAEMNDGLCPCNGNASEDKHCPCSDYREKDKRIKLECKATPVLFFTNLIFSLLLIRPLE